MKICVIGLGLMGLPMALRLQQCGHEVTGWNRSEGRRQAAAAQGLEVRGDLPAAIEQAELLLLALSDAQAIHATLFETPKPLAGRLLLQMGTIAPGESRELARLAADAGADYLEAPVLGSIPEARAGSLIVMAGGPEASYQRCLLLLRCLGKEVERIGEVGQGAALKLAMNQLIGALTAGFSLSLGLIQAEGVPVESFMQLLRASALYAPTFDKKLQKMLGHDYASANFPLKHLIKDIALFQQVAREDGLETGLPGSLLQLLERARAAGHAEEDYSALYEAVNPSLDLGVDEGC